MLHSANRAATPSVVRLAIVTTLCIAVSKSLAAALQHRACYKSVTLPSSLVGIPHGPNLTNSLT
jgi:hypothetical protein